MPFSFVMGLFGKSPSRDPKEQVREWTSKLRKEQNQIERQVRQIQRQEAKVSASLKQAAKKGDKDVCKGCLHIQTETSTINIFIMIISLICERVG